MFSSSGPSSLNNARLSGLPSLPLRLSLSVSPSRSPSAPTDSTPFVDFVVLFSNSIHAFFCLLLLYMWDPGGKAVFFSFFFFVRWTFVEAERTRLIKRELLSFATPPLFSHFICDFIYYMSYLWHFTPHSRSPRGRCYNWEPALSSRLNKNEDHIKSIKK